MAELINSIGAEMAEEENLQEVMIIKQIAMIYNSNMQDMI